MYVDVVSFADVCPKLLLSWRVLRFSMQFSKVSKIPASALQKVLLTMAWNNKGTKKDFEYWLEEFNLSTVTTFIYRFKYFQLKSNLQKTGSWMHLFSKKYLYIPAKKNTPKTDHWKFCFRGNCSYVCFNMIKHFFFLKIRNTHFHQVM